MRALSSLNMVAKTEHIGSKCILELYRSLVLPQLEYAVGVWQVGNGDTLEKVQRRGLAICPGIPKTAGVQCRGIRSRGRYAFTCFKKRRASGTRNWEDYGKK